MNSDKLNRWLSLLANGPQERQIVTIFLTIQDYDMMIWIFVIFGIPRKRDTTYQLVTKMMNLVWRVQLSVVPASAGSLPWM